MAVRMCRDFANQQHWSIMMLDSGGVVFLTEKPKMKEFHNYNINEIEDEYFGVDA